MAEASQLPRLLDDVPNIQRFFKSMIRDPRDSMEAFFDLAEELPRRGRQLVPWHRRLKAVLATKQAATGVSYFRNARAIRELQCAELIQFHARAWLYKPDGPIFRKGVRELGGLVGD